MTQDIFLRRKWTLRAHGHQVVFVKCANERTAHVLMKAFLLRFPADSAGRFVDDRGQIRLTHDDLELWRYGGHRVPDLLRHAAVPGDDGSAGAGDTHAPA